MPEIIREKGQGMCANGFAKWGIAHRALKVDFKTHSSIST